MIEIIRKYIDNNKRILIVGIGNVLKRDDGVGVYVSQRIDKTENMNTLTVEISIENYIGKINRINPDLLVLVDCVDFGEPSGHYRILPLGRLVDRTTNTHNISLSRLEEFFKMPIVVIGIQPEIVSFGEGLSVTVERAARGVLEALSNL